MINLKLIYDFFMIGFFSFGGGYATIPMVKDIVDKYDAFDVEMLENFIAISESTPGPIAVNLSTFVGNAISGFFGGIIATLFEILPAFIIILVFAAFLKKYIDNERVKFVLSIIRPCLVGIIMSVGIIMYGGQLTFDNNNYILKYIIITVLILIFMKIYKIVFNKNISTINIIVLSGFFGIVINKLL